MAEAGNTVRKTARGLFLEDLHVGQRFSSASHTIDEGADQGIRGAIRPAAVPSRRRGGETARLFGGLAASGWHTAAITMRLLVESGLPLEGGIIGSGGEVSWPKPTRPGDTLTVMSEIEEVTPSRSRPERGMIRVRNETRNQHGEIVQLLIAKLVVPRRTATAAAPDARSRDAVVQ